MSKAIGTRGHTVLTIGVIISLLISFMPVKLLFQPSSGDFFKDNDIRDNKHCKTDVNRPRLAKTTDRFTNGTSKLIEKANVNYRTNHSLSNFAINAQSGQGSGSMNIKDSYNWTGITTINTTNEINQVTGLPTSHNDSITVSHPSNYNRQKGWFNISDVIANKDYRLIEDYEYDRGFVNSKSSGDAIYEIAMSFTISEDLANLTKIRTYTSGSGQASGLTYIVNSTSGEPDDTKIISSQLSLVYSSPQWNEYEFIDPIVLKGGITYFIVMNTTSKNKVWNWFYQNDTLDDGIDEGNVYFKMATHDQNNWTFWDNTDLPLIIEVLPLVKNGSFFTANTYINSTELSISYNTIIDSTEISSFLWFEWNDTETHIFQTNTSVHFTLSFIANYTYSLNPINGSIDYLVNNGTASLWNVTFSTNALNKTYLVRNRTITIQNINVDWNGSAIFHNGSYIYNSTNVGGLNGSITYTNGSNTMIVNSSNLSDAKEWGISFNAPNYIQEFSWMLNTIPVTSANATDTLLPNITFNPKGVGGKNLTVFIESSSGTQVYYNTNESITSPVLDDWDVNQSTYSLPEANGTYESAAFWYNGTSNQVGFFTRDVKIFINTTFVVDIQSEILINSLLNITVHYNTTHNGTAIDQANVTGKPSWGSQETEIFSQMASRYPYNLSFDINNSQHNPGDLITVIITANLRWYINHSVIATIRVIEEATLTVNATDITLEWRNNATLLIFYNDSSDNPIPNATISVSGDSENITFNNGAYYYELNSTNFAGVGFYPNNEILSIHSNYSSKEVNFSVTITSGNTSINTWSKGQSISNNTPGYTQIYSNSSKDNVSINLRYYFVLVNETLNTSEPTISSLIPYNVPVKEFNWTWTILFNPNKTGTFLINISFNLVNYNSSTFVFKLIISKAPTTLSYEFNIPITVFYAENFEFFLIYNNTAYNENITGLTEGDGITINETTKVIFVNQTEYCYWFRFGSSPLPLSFHAINITFEHEDFEPSSLVVVFEVVARPTSIEAIDSINGTILINGTSTYSRHYSPSSFDNFSIKLSYFDNQSGNTLNTTGVILQAESSIDYSYSMDIATFNWTFLFNGSIIGSYKINITFSLQNYSISTFMVLYVINPANTKISNSSVNPFPSQTEVTSNNTFEFWVEWHSEYNEGINDSNGVTINSTDINLIETDPITGNHTFRFSKTDVGIYTYNLTFLINNYNKSVLLVQFRVKARKMILNVSLSTHDNGSTVTTLMSGDIYYWIIFLNDNETGRPVTATPIILPLSNISFNGADQGNHSFSYEASEVGIFSSLVITFNLANYRNYTYSITFVVNKRNFFFDSDFSTVDNDSVPVQINFNNSYYFNVFLRDEKTLNAVNASNIIVPLNITSELIVSSGNHSFRYYAGAIGQNFSLSIVFTKQNYHNLTYIIKFDVFSRIMAFNNNFSTHATPAAVNLQYGDIYYIKIFIEDNETGIPLNILDPIGMTENLTLVNTSSGYHMFRFQAWSLQPEINSIDFSLFNYQSITYKISFFITEVNSEIVSPPSTISTTYSINKQFSLIWQSIPLLNTSPVLRINSSNIDIQMSSLEWSGFIIFQNHSNGNYTFVILANKKAGTFTVMLEFRAEGFIDTSIQIQIIILSIGSTFNSADPANASIIAEPFYFTESQNIVIGWIETINGSGLVDTEPKYGGNGTDLIIFTNWFSNGTHIFNVRADKIGIYELRIIFNVTNYQVSLYILTIHISPMKTIEPNIVYPPELLVGEQLFVLVEEWLTINSERVSISNLEEHLEIWNGSKTVDFTIDAFEEDRFTFIINTEDYRKGIQNLKVILFCYGFENQTMNISFNLTGRVIAITIDIIPEEIVQGSDFRIKVILEYEPLTNNIVGSGAGISLQSLDGVEVTFEVDILYENGNTKTLFNISKVQALGESRGVVEFVIKGENTLGAEGISRITISSSETASGLAGFRTTPENFLENYLFKKKTTENPIVIDPILIASIIILSLLFFSALITLKSFHNRSQSQKKIQKEIENRFSDLLNLRGIIFRNNHGLTFYTENFRIKDQDGELIAGLAAAMSSLVDQVSHRILKEGEFDILERDNFGIFSHQGKFSVLSAILSGKMSSYLRNKLVIIHKQIEQCFSSEKLGSILINSRTEEIKKIIYDNLPLGLLKPLLVEEEVLKEKLKSFKKTEKKMYEFLDKVPSFIDGQQIFFALTMISSLTARGISITDAILFLEKLHSIGGLRNLTAEEIYVLNIPEDYTSI
ncbi:MAG: hypothetical protein ACXAC8_06660 [Candidatus Hodarchaeales archaeon]